MRLIHDACRVGSKNTQLQKNNSHLSKRAASAPNFRLLRKFPKWIAISTFLQYSSAFQYTFHISSLVSSLQRFVTLLGENRRGAKRCYTKKGK